MTKPFDFTVRCSDKEYSSQPATYKIAAEWSAGSTTELKTYGFANDACLDKVYFAALDRLLKIRPSEGERIGRLRIFRLDTSRHDYELDAAEEHEERLEQARRQTAKAAT